MDIFPQKVMIGRVYMYIQHKHKLYGVMHIYLLPKYDPYDNINVTSLYCFHVGKIFFHDILILTYGTSYLFSIW